MNWIPSFGAWQFAAAGLAGAAGTILIHLLNRRRHQVLHWGAMEFLQRAVKRKRRSIQLRDAILLTLRSLAVLFFGIALARPHFSADDTVVGPRPIHAIIVVDNSLSMSYSTLDGTLLDKAKRAAAQIVERLPSGSNTSILNSSDSAEFESPLPIGDLDVAIAAIERIDITDTAANINDMLAKATAAATFETNLPTRTVLLTDQQATTWQGYNATTAASELKRLQIVDLAPPDRDNTWIADIAVQDGFAEARTQATVRVVVQHSGGRSVRNAEASLFVHDQLVATKSLSLDAGDSSQTVTFQHSFATSIASGVTFAPVKAVLTPDRLAIDDTRYAIVPVTTRLPIVFVDQVGSSDENIRLGRLGETRALRRLLSNDRDDDLREVTLDQRHIKLSELAAETIRDARLVVVAGVGTPRGKVTLLREFVKGGGQLLIAAGGHFAAAKWQEHAWLDGNGVLPARLTNKSIGTTPNETQGELAPMLLSFDSIKQNDLFRLPRVPDETLRDLYSEPLFFKTIEIDESNGGLADFRVVARLGSINGPPLLVERSIGKGRVLFWSSSLSADWNTVAKSNAVVMLDRLSREAIRSTIADHNRAAQSQIHVALPVAARDSTVLLRRPNQPTAVELASGYIDRDQFGVTIRDEFRRGLYTIAAMPKRDNEDTESTDPLWELELAINGASNESDLTAADQASVAALAQVSSVTLAHSAEEVSLADTNLLGQSVWWWCALFVLTLVLAEMLVLVMAHRGRAAVQKAGIAV